MNMLALKEIPTEDVLGRLLRVTSDHGEASRNLDKPALSRLARDLDRVIDLAIMLRSGCERLGADPAEARTVAPPQNVFRREGDYWTIGFGADVVRLRGAKGLRYIAHLLRHPGVEIHAAELAGIDRDGGEGRRPLGDAGEIIDHRARESYRRRLDDLGEELAEAECFNDSGRAARARAEIDALTTQLAAAVGIGGRARRASSATERARIMVTKRIKLGLRKVATETPVLGRYLAETIRTGIFCCYEPDPRLGPGFEA